ncbi:MAG: hypothetical protein Kow0069_34710 [Promethearchaeota archaeon]
MRRRSLVQASFAVLLALSVVSLVGPLTPGKDPPATAAPDAVASESPVPVLLVGDDPASPYRVALGLDPGVNLTVVEQADLSTGQVAATASAGGAIFLEESSELSREQAAAVTDAVAAGAGLFFQTPSPGQPVNAAAFEPLADALPVDVPLEGGRVAEEPLGFGNVNTRVTGDAGSHFLGERVGFISLPQLLNLTITSLKPGANATELVRSESGRPLFLEGAHGSGRVLALAAPVRLDSNEHLADWPLFNYWIFVCANYLAGNEDVPSFGDWPYSPVPHEDARAVVLVLLVAMAATTAGLFVHFRRKSRREPLALLPAPLPARAGEVGGASENERAPGEAAGKRSWDDVGYHKPLAGAFVMLFLTLVVLMPLLVLVLHVLPTFILTDPSQIGIQFITGSIFSAVFIAADFGLAQAFDRFVGENYGKDPRKALKYVQFFFWFQITSGLAQTTVISVLGLYFVPHWNSVNFLAWFFVFKSFVQWPGVAYIFTHLLKSMQRADKEQLVMLVNLLFVQLAGTVLFTTLMRQWGASDPRVGSVVGGSLGLTVADTVSQFSLVLLGAWFLARVDKRFRLADVFRVDFDAAVVKETLWFGLRAMLSNVIYLFGNFATTVVVVNRLDNYTYWGTFLGAGTYLFFPMIYLTGLYENALPTTAEAYGAKKEELTAAYASYGFKYFGAFGSLIFVLFTFFLSQFITAVVPPLFKPMGWFIALYSITRMFVVLGDFSRLFLVAIDRVSLYVALVLVEQVVRVALVLAFVERWQYWVLVFGELPGVVFKVAAAWLWTHRRVLPVRVNAWQTLVAPGVAATATLAVGGAVTRWGYPAATRALGTLPATLLFTLATFAGVTLLLWPAVLALAGGWDAETLSQLEFAANNCGPSKPLAGAFYRVTAWACRRSPLFDAHPIPHAAAAREAQELLALKERASSR